MTVLLGPADADHFRVKVGRYGDRWYHDPLPKCSVADACDTVWPSISTCKKASGSDWSFVALKRVAQALEQDPDRLRNLDLGGRYDTLKSINQRGLEAAGQRGTNIHLYCEARLRGTTPPLMVEGSPGWNYLPAVDAFFDTYQPELVAAEYVTIHRTLNGTGYGGTPDAIVRIDGGLHAIDWKSRGEDSDHGAYPEEAAQIAAGTFADYMIVEGPSGPERRPIPTLAGGLVISIKHDGCRVYPVDLEKAAKHWEALHGWWVARREERAPVGRPWTPKKAAAPVLSRRDELRARCKAIAAHSPKGAVWMAENWPDTPALSADHTFTDAELDLIDAHVTHVETLTDAPFTISIPPVEPPRNEPPPAATKIDPPTEGDTVPLDTIRPIYEASDREWIGTFAREAHTAGRSIYVSQLASQRRVSILEGLCALSTRSDRDSETAAAVAYATGLPTGDVSLLDHGSAQLFAATCHLIVDGLITVADGVLTDAA